MPPLIDLRVAELLCARLCHELVSPVGAINNGVELLSEEEPDFLKPDFLNDAVALIGQSARKAGQRLQFYRLAYGVSSAGGDPRELLAGLFEGGKVELDWHPEVAELPREWQILACNIAVIAAEALPRGGTVAVKPGAPSSGGGLAVTGTGEAVNLPEELGPGLGRKIAVADLSARNVHPCFTACLAEALGARVILKKVNAGSFVLTAGTG